MSSVVFLMPHDGIVPAGGFKVVYEYANRLAADGIPVTIVYPNTKRWGKHTLLTRGKDVARFLVRKANQGYRSRWFRFHPAVRFRWVWSLSTFRYAESDRVVATAVETAYYLNQYKLPSSQKFYFIQDYENWYFSDEFVRASYHYDMRKIVIARWLQRIVEECGEKADFVPNGFDFNFFHLSVPVEQRDRHNVVCMYHVDKRKGLDVAFKAFDLVRERCPQLCVHLFSVYEQPDTLPAWFHFHRQPDKTEFNRLYNQAAIYVGSSNIEGWGLTVGEAMQCGCAVACTDNRGYLEMAVQGRNALVSPVGDAEALAANIIRLMDDDALRCRLARQGEQDIHQFDINKSYQKFKSCLMSV